MGEIDDNIIDKNSINVARNTPLALVVGVAGFLGSHVAEGLIEKNIQVIGVDNFSTGKKEHLTKLSQIKEFHFLNIDAQKLNLDIPRLDYIFIATTDGWKINSVLDLAKEFKSKVVFISKIVLYDRDAHGNLQWYKQAESQLAKFASENKLNARVVRLATLFGPKMDFKGVDPMTRLIKAALLAEIQNESAGLEFSSRALFIEDAVSLVIKSMLAGSTASKIFDGVGEPVKVSEIKQILINPTWHKSRGFKLSEIPPWPTPNLNKTKKELNWQPRVNLVRALEETLDYFKDHDIDISKDTNLAPPDIKEEGWEDRIDNWKKVVAQESQKEVVLKTKKGFRFELLGILIGWGVIVAAFFYPIISLGANVLGYKINLSQASINIREGHFEAGMENINLAQAAAESIGDALKPVQLLSKTGFLVSQVDSLEKITFIAKLVAQASKQAVLGAHQLQLGLMAVTTGVGGSRDLFKNAQLDLNSADEKYSKAGVLLAEVTGLNDAIFKNYLDHFKQKLAFYNNLVQKMSLLAQILPQLSSDNKSYLILLTQNGNLRGGGGVIKAATRVDFSEGKLKKIDTLKDDLGKTSTSLEDSAWEPDVPTNGRKAQELYLKETGLGVGGVVYVDTSALGLLLSSIGGVEVLGSGTISGENLKEKLADNPDTLSPKILDATLRKILFIPDYWDESLITLSDSLDKKQLLVYFSDPSLSNLLSSQQLFGVIPRVGADFSDFLLVSENNLSENLANETLRRNYHLLTNIDSKGQLSHTLRINYLNRNQYEFGLRLYLPTGSKLTKALWGENNLLPEVTSLVDFERQVYSMKLGLTPKNEKNLILVYENAKLINLSKLYRLEVIKQPGTDSDGFNWELSGVKEQRITTDLSVDRSFEVALR